MDKCVEVERLLSQARMEYEHRDEQLKSEERMIDVKITSLTDKIHGLQHSPRTLSGEGEKTDNERAIHEFEIQILDEKARLTELKHRERENDTQMRQSIEQLQREIDIEKRKERRDSFMGKIGL